MLLRAQRPVRAEPGRGVRDVPARPPRGAAPADPAALRVPPGAPPAGGLGLPYGTGAGCASRLAIQSTPGVSVSPCARIDTKTHRAARSKIRSSPSKPDVSTSSENVIVATPFGPNQAMKAFTA